ncbi:MAG: NAD(P)/FAD-dependent oxidoreductase [Desulfurococcaceae archaeon]
MREVDVAIIGAGPAGLFSAYELISRNSGLKIIVFDKGVRPGERKCPLIQAQRSSEWKNTDCFKCSVCHVMEGVGGAGFFSSGIINLRPDVGGDLDKLIGSWSVAEDLIKYIDSILVKFGAPDNVYSIGEEQSKRLERLSARAGAKFIPTLQRHIGSENTVYVIENLVNYLENKGVYFSTSNYVEDIVREDNLFKIKSVRGVFYSKFVILAPGRSGAEWFRDIALKMGIEIEPGPLDIGVRVEIPSYIAEPITRIVRDPKFILYTRVYDDKVRTFCFNPNGFVIQETYSDGTVGVNGESYVKMRSRNSNFALLVTVKLTDPLEDTIAYGKKIACLSTKLGGGKPIIQRLGDLLDGRRSTWDRIARSSIEPTLRNVTPGDISMALPYRIVANIIEALERLDTIIPGLYSQQTLLYTPEIKYYSVKARVNKDLETNIDNLFVAGDGAGLSRGINIAAATGVIAARGVLNKL